MGCTGEDFKYTQRVVEVKLLENIHLQNKEGEGRIP
jgi:hypothetical protein